MTILRIFQRKLRKKIDPTNKEYDRVCNGNKKYMSMGEIPGPGPEDIEFKNLGPEDILREEGSTKVIPIERRYPSEAQAYKDKEAIAKGEVAKPIDEERFRKISEWVLGKDNPENVNEVGDLRTTIRDFYGGSTDSRRLGYIDAFKGKTFNEVVSEFGNRPNFLRENLFTEFVETIEQESKAPLLNGESDLGELSAEERLAVETFYGYPRAVLNQIQLDRQKEISESIQKQYFEGLSSTTILVEADRLRQIQTSREFTPEQNQRLTIADEYSRSMSKVFSIKRELAQWQQDLYKFIVSNQNNPQLPITMKSFFATFEENMTVQENFTRFIGGDTKGIMARLRAGALAPVTVVKAFEQIAEKEIGRVPTEVFLPRDVRSDTEQGIDLIAGGMTNYLILQVKHTEKIYGVEIDGELTYNDKVFAQSRRAIFNSAKKYMAVLGNQSVVVPRMVIVGKVGLEARYTGIPHNMIRLSGKTTSRQIWEKGGEAWTTQ